ncbi:MAG: MFS transporter [Burkholderiaceae bacterium]
MSADSLLPRGLAIRVFACLAGGYFMSYALRSINAAIAPELVREFGLSNAALGSLSAAYFFAFAAMQLPLGTWLDRYGSRRTDAALLLLAAAGCFVFSMAQGVGMLWVGRALIGAGVAGALMSSLRAFRFWYAPQRQGQLVAWMLVVGTGGALASTVPVRAALPIYGWRGVFVAAGVLLIVASMAIRWLLPRNEQTQPKVANGPGLWRGYLDVYADRYFWRFGVMAVVVHSGFISFQSLWTGPWFTEVLAMTPDQAAEALFLLNLVLMFGFLLLGWLAPRLERAGLSVLRLVALTTVVVIALHVAIAFASGPLALVLWIVYAVVATYYTLMQTHVSLSFPPALTGRAFTAYNLLIFGGIFLAQWLFGGLVDLIATTGVPLELAFRRALLVWTGAEVLALAWLVGFRARPRTAA